MSRLRGAMPSDMRKPSQALELREALAAKLSELEHPVLSSEQSESLLEVLLQAPLDLSPGALLHSSFFCPVDSTFARRLPTLRASTSGSANHDVVVWISLPKPIP